MSVRLRTLVDTQKRLAVDLSRAREQQQLLLQKDPAMLETGADEESVHNCSSSGTRRDRQRGGVVDAQPPEAAGPGEHYAARLAVLLDHAQPRVAAAQAALEGVMTAFRWTAEFYCESVAGGAWKGQPAAFLSPFLELLEQLAAVQRDGPRLARVTALLAEYVGAQAGSSGGASGDACSGGSASDSIGQHTAATATSTPGDGLGPSTTTMSKCAEGGAAQQQQRLAAAQQLLRAHAASVQAGGINSDLPVQQQQQQQQQCSGKPLLRVPLLALASLHARPAMHTIPQRPGAEASWGSDSPRCITQNGPSSSGSSGGVSSAGAAGGSDGSSSQCSSASSPNSPSSPAAAVAAVVVQSEPACAVSAAPAGVQAEPLQQQQQPQCTLHENMRSLATKGARRAGAGAQQDACTSGTRVMERPAAATEARLARPGQPAAQVARRAAGMSGGRQRTGQQQPQTHTGVRRWTAADAEVAAAAAAVAAASSRTSSKPVTRVVKQDRSASPAHAAGKATNSAPQQQRMDALRLRGRRSPPHVRSGQSIAAGAVRMRDHLAALLSSSVDSEQ